MHMYPLPALVLLKGVIWEFLRDWGACSIGYGLRPPLLAMMSSILLSWCSFNLRIQICNGREGLEKSTFTEAAKLKWRKEGK